MDSNKKAFKSGFFYAIASITNALLVFATTPFFTRVMNKTTYGEYNNFLSWYNILSIITLNLSSTFISARKDYEKEYDSYVLSMVVMNLSISGLFGLVFSFFSKQVYALTTLNMEYIYVLLVYAAFNQIFVMYQVNERFNFRYKISVLLIILCSLSTTVISVLLVLYVDNQMFARVFGLVVPTIIVGVVCLVTFFRHGGRVRFRYWLYALPICIPYIPHLLSLNILNSSDKAMITNMVGSTETAIYSVAYTCGSIVSLIIGILNNAYVPWFADKLNNNAEGEIAKFSKYYLLMFQILVVGVMLFSPEIVLILGGNQYKDAIDILPAITIGCSTQLIYTMCVNVEQYLKKTKGMAVVSICAALTNVILNFCLIPRFGYKVAAFTTLISYFVLVFGHIYIIKKIGYDKIFNLKCIYGVLLSDFVLCFVFGLVYANICIRVILIGLFFVSGIGILVKYKEVVKNIITFILNKK